MRWAIAFILLLTLISVRVHALAITEVMPDCGNLTANCEFVEIYSASDVDLRGYVLDTQGQSLKFNTSFSGYLVITKNKNAFIKRFGSGPTEGYVIEWKAMGLANGGDVVTLIYENKSVGSFEYEKSDKNSSWQNIGSWNMCKPTPLKENFCEKIAVGKEVNTAVEEPKKSPTPKKDVEKDLKENSGESKDAGFEKSGSDVVQIDIGDEITKNEDETTFEEEDVPRDVIRLGGEDIKTYYSRNENVREYAIYGFAVFCVLFIVLLLIGQGRKHG